MKKFRFSTLLLVPVAVLALSSCKGDDDDDTPPPANTVVVLEGEITSQRLTADKSYLIRGQAFVRTGQTLTIDPGTVIKGERSSRGTLIVDRGGKIMAQGEVNKPIVFTSNQAPGERDRGDWGGLVILGNAPVNQVSPVVEGITPAATFGGTDPADNSGILKYVRVEFAGIEISPNNETNGITLAGVGNGTVMEYVMVSFGGDDGFEFFGGTVNAKHLIVFAGWDDDYDVDYGYAGKVQFGVGIRYKGYADQSESNGFECDNGPNDNDVSPYTTGTFSNMTILGPVNTGTSAGNNNFAHTIDLRRRTAVSIFNSVFAGYPKGARMNQQSVVDQYVTKGNGVIQNNIFYFPASPFLAGTGVAVNDVKTYIEAGNLVVSEAASAAKNTELGIDNDWYFGTRLANGYTVDPNFTVTAGTSTTGASFAHAKLAGFETVTYRGAFGATDWTNTWTNFAPVNAAY